MKVYGSSAIRNVAFVGHGASGKTSLVDALAWVSGCAFLTARSIRFDIEKATL